MKINFFLDRAFYLKLSDSSYSCGDQISSM